MRARRHPPLPSDLATELHDLQPAAYLAGNIFVTKLIGTFIYFFPISTPELAVGVMIIAAAPGGATSNLFTSYKVASNNKGEFRRNLHICDSSTFGYASSSQPHTFFIMANSYRIADNAL